MLIGMLANAAVQVFTHAYHLLDALRSGYVWRSIHVAKGKKYIALLQVARFVASFGCVLYTLWLYHIQGERCLDMPSVMALTQTLTQTLTPTLTLTLTTTLI